MAAFPLDGTFQQWNPTLLKGPVPQWAEEEVPRVDPSGVELSKPKEISLGFSRRLGEHSLRPAHHLGQPAIPRGGCEQHRQALCAKTLLIRPLDTAEVTSDLA